MPAAKPQEDYVSPLKAGTLPQEVVQECADALAKGRPYTRIRPLQEGVDDPKGHSCDGAQGSHHLDCNAEVVAVQYSSAQGEVVFYCEPHALEQNDWDIVLYDSKPKDPPKMSEEDHKEVQKILAKIGRKRKKREEPEELDPTA